MTLEASPQTRLQFRALETPADYAALSDLLDRSFPVPAGAHFFDDFPIWSADLTAKSPSRFLRLGGFSGNKLVCFTGVRIARLKTPGGPLPVALIGGVCTDSEWRGQQLASTLVSAALQWSARQNVALTALWGSEHALYERLGFELCGMQARVSLQALPSTEKGCDLRQGWTPGLLHSLSDRPTGLELSPHDLPWVSAHKNVRWFWTGSEQRPRAYAALGKGIDLPNLVHEWGGNDADLRSLLSAIGRIHPEAGILGHPAHLANIGFAVPEESIEFLCMIRIFDHASILSAFDPGLKFSISPKDNGYAIGVKGSPLVELTARETARLFFGPGSFDAPFGEVFPLPLWLWGLDGA